MKFAIVIPAYNEEATITNVIEQVKHAGTVIVINDASSDATASLAEIAGAVVVTHEDNRGYDGALQSGFEKADKLGMDSVITFDADGQHDPTVLTIISNDLQYTSAQLVLGVRSSSARFGEAIFNYWTQLRFGVGDMLCGLKGYNIELYRKHGYFDQSGSIGTELALASLRKGCEFSTVHVPISDREDQARFGSVFKANMRILRALSLAIWADLKKVT